MSIKIFTKMVEYLYYKLYNAFLKSSVKDIPHIVTPAALGALLGINLIIINSFLAKINIMPFLFTSSNMGGWFNATLIFFAFLYFNKQRREIVLEKYSHESESRRKRGNAMVWVYVILSFLSIFAVAFYKPGKV